MNIRTIISYDSISITLYLIAKKTNLLDHMNDWKDRGGVDIVISEQRVMLKLFTRSHCRGSWSTGRLPPERGAKQVPWILSASYVAANK